MTECGRANTEPTGRHLSPERRAAGELASTLLDRALVSCGVSQAQVASAIGVCRERVRDWCDADKEPAITLRDLVVVMRRLPTLGAELVRAQANLVDERRGPGLAPLAHVARVSAEAGDLARTVSEALADGDLDAAERERIDRELAHVISAAEAARRDLRK